MAVYRLLSPFEIRHFDAEVQWGNVPKADVTLFASSAVRGDIDLDILRRVLAELAAGHVLLRAVVVQQPGPTLRFVRRENFQPTLTVTEGGEDEYLSLINAEDDWSSGLFKAHVLRRGERTQIVLIMHHGMCDGRSAFALLGEMWQRYAAHLAGSPLPLPDSDNELIDGIDTQLAATIPDAEVDAFLAQLRAIALATDPTSIAPRELPRDGDGVGDPLGRVSLRRIELTAAETAELVTAARAHGFSVNSLVTGAALAAARTHLEVEPEPVPMVCGHAVDVRSEVDPALPETTILNCVGGLATPAFASADADPIELAKAVEAGIRGALDARVPALFMRAQERELDPAIAAMFAAHPTLGMSNLGRLPEHSLPEGLEVVRDEVFGMALGMPPKMTFFTVGDRLTIQVEYDTARNSHAQMGRVTDTLREQIRRVTTTD